LRQAILGEKAAEVRCREDSEANWVVKLNGTHTNKIELSTPAVTVRVSLALACRPKQRTTCQTT
jgi:hypothetical protein